MIDPAGARAARFRPLGRAEDGAPSPLRTEVAIAADARRLLARFRCAFRELTPVGSSHDDDLWRGDVVELFVAADPDDRRVYHEIEVNPAGLVFDARVVSPDLDRRTMRVDRGWNPAGLRAGSRVLAGAEPQAGGPARRFSRCGRAGTAEPLGGAGGARGIWVVRISLDWAEIVPGGRRPAAIALGAARIDRRSWASPLHLALFPNFETPVNFHTPRSFGVLRLDT